MLNWKIAMLCVLANSGITTVVGMKPSSLPKLSVIAKKPCKNLCKRNAYGTFDSCCQACVHVLHTKMCSLRNTHIVFEGKPGAKSAKLDPNSGLYHLAKALQLRIYQEFATAKPPFNDELHVTLVDDQSNTKDKQNNFTRVQEQLIDITDVTQWDCAANAFALSIGTFPGHHKSVHLTIVYFPEGCTDKLDRLRKLVQEIVRQFSH